MGRYRFVEPDRQRLKLSDDDWIDVKKELNAGEQRSIFSGMVKEQRSGENALLDPDQVGLTKLVVYILGWSFKDAEGNRVAVTASAINSLDVDTYREINDAIDVHMAAVEHERMIRKNGQGGEKELPVISPSPDAAAGVSSGSAN